MLPDEISKTSLLLPLMVSKSAPGPLIIKFREIVNPPFRGKAADSVITCEVLKSDEKTIMSFAAETAIASRKEQSASHTPSFVS
jgi:hypothetical protein